jgi:hypothetical protein
LAEPRRVTLPLGGAYSLGPDHHRLVDRTKRPARSAELSSGQVEFRGDLRDLRTR